MAYILSMSTRRSKIWLMSLLACVFCHGKAICQLVQGRKIKHDLAINEMLSPAKLLDVMKSNDSANFALVVSGNYVNSVLLTRPTSELSMITVNLNNDVPSVLQKNYFFLFDVKNASSCYANADTVLIDKKNKMPLVFVTSLKGKFFAQRATIVNGKVVNGSPKKIWENYLKDNCTLFNVNNLCGKRKLSKYYIIMRLTNSCNGSKEDFFRIKI